jgi:formylmethanofuran dehydrogenase subunit E
MDRDTVRRVADFHGHMCPGLAMGIRASEVALEQIGSHADDEEVVAIVETDMCGVDAIQFLLGCTFGKGNLVHRDYGKNAYTVLRRSDGKAVRISEQPGMRTATPLEPEPQGEDEFFARQRERVDQILTVPLEELYQVREVQIDPPHLARVFTSVACAACGEATMETRIHRLNGDELCPPCFEERLAEL